MTALLDTHVVLWLLTDDPALGPATRGWLPQQDRLLVLTASLWEIAIKSRLGRLDAPEGLPELVTRSGLAWLSVSADHVGRTREINGLPHGDPFDRLLVAQALVENCVLVTADRVLLGAPLRPLPTLRNARD